MALTSPTLPHPPPLLTRHRRRHHLAKPTLGFTFININLSLILSLALRQHLLPPPLQFNDFGFMNFHFIVRSINGSTEIWNGIV
jgi:hypothetical protein